jgi:hypothetical protein
MRLLTGLVVVAFLAAASCGGDDGSGPGRGDYFTQLERVSETAHIQERGLRHDLNGRLNRAGSPDARLTAVVVYVDQSARLYEDVVDALGDLDPPDEIRAAHQGYLDAWRTQLDLVIAVRDAGFPGPAQYLEALDQQAFDNAGSETRSTCDALQTAVTEEGAQVDLVCDGRPAR